MVLAIEYDPLTDQEMYSKRFTIGVGLTCSACGYPSYMATIRVIRGEAITMPHREAREMSVDVRMNLFTLFSPYDIYQTLILHKQV